MITAPTRADLFVVAHPDDEVVFFGGLIGDLARAGVDVDVVCATSHFDQPTMTSTRRAEFRRACWRMRVGAELLGFHDTAAPLSVPDLAAALRRIDERRPYDAVYTHGVWGEYGHRHHRDVCLAVHLVFGCRVLCLAGPFAAERCKALTPAELAVKRGLAASTYFSQPFARDWCSSEERFAQIPLAVVEALYAMGNGEPRAPAVGPVLDRDIGDAARRSRDAFERGGIPFAEVAHVPAAIWGPLHRALAERLAKAWSGSTCDSVS